MYMPSNIKTWCQADPTFLSPQVKQEDAEPSKTRGTAQASQSEACKGFSFWEVADKAFIAGGNYLVLQAVKPTASRMYSGRGRHHAAARFSPAGWRMPCLKSVVCILIFPVSASNLVNVIAVFHPQIDDCR